MLCGLLDRNHIQPVLLACLLSCICGKYVETTDDAKRKKGNILNAFWPVPEGTHSLKSLILSRVFP